MSMKSDDKLAAARQRLAHLTREGVKFSYCEETRMLGGEHPGGGCFTIAEMVNSLTVKAHTSGVLLAAFLNGELDENFDTVIGEMLLPADVERMGLLGRHPLMQFNRLALEYRMLRRDMEIARKPADPEHRVPAERTLRGDPQPIHCVEIAMVEGRRVSRRCPAPLYDRLCVWWQNFTTIPQRWMAAFLKKRGWVVFYLDERSRVCHGRGGCWLKLYQEGEDREKAAKALRAAEKRGEYVETFNTEKKP